MKKFAAGVFVGVAAIKLSKSRPIADRIYQYKQKVTTKLAERVIEELFKLNKTYIETNENTRYSK